jgi:hypothetical protein
MIKRRDPQKSPRSISRWHGLCLRLRLCVCLSSFLNRSETAVSGGLCAGPCAYAVNAARILGGGMRARDGKMGHTSQAESLNSKTCTGVEERRDKGEGENDA